MMMSVARPEGSRDQYPTIEVPIEQLDVESFPNARTHFDRVQFESLILNIKQRRKILEDPIVRRKSLECIALQEKCRHQAKKRVPGDPDKGYEVIAGYQRTMAAIRIYKESERRYFSVLQVKLAQVDDEEARWIQLSENLARSPLTFVDQTNAFLELEKKGRDAQYIADRLGVSRPWVAQRISFRNSAHPALIAAVDEKILVFTTAYAIMRDLKDDLASQAKAAAAARHADADFMEKNEGSVVSPRLRSGTASLAAAVETDLRKRPERRETRPRGRSSSVYGYLTSASRMRLVEKLEQRVAPLVPEARSWKKVDESSFDAGVFYALQAQSDAEKTKLLLKRYGLE